jgi:hypothetical protein
MPGSDLGPGCLLKSGLSEQHLKSLLTEFSLGPLFVTGLIQGKGNQVILIACLAVALNQGELVAGIEFLRNLKRQLNGLLGLEKTLILIHESKLSVNT